MDALIDQALATVDDDKREALLQQASQVVIEDYGILPLHFEVTPWAFRKGIPYVPRADQYTLALGVKPAGSTATLRPGRRVDSARAVTVGGHAGPHQPPGIADARPPPGPPR